jgi:hypothetical protein
MLCVASPWAGGQPDTGELTEPRADPIKVEVEEGRLSVQALDATLSEVLRAVAARAPFDLRVAHDVDRKITRRIFAVPLERALRSLLGGYDFAMVYDSSRPGLLSELHVFGLSACSTEESPPEHATPQSAGQQRMLTRRRTALLREVVRLADVPDDVALQQLSTALLSADDVLLRRAAILELSRLDARAVPILAQALTDLQPTVRADAVRAIARIGGDGALEAMHIGLEDPAAAVRMHAVRAIAKMADDDQVGALERALSVDASSKVRREAFLALIARGAQQARAALVVATDDPDPIIRAAATSLLASWN